MAKIQGLVGGLSGKLGNAVFRQRYGETIVAQYQPVVSNPNTDAQQVARAKFKLITQLATIMAPAMGTLGVINRPARKGRNPRSGFVAKNYALMTANPSAEDAEKISIQMDSIQLTDSFRPLTNLSDESTTSTLVVSASGLPSDIASVRFVIVEYLEFNEIKQAAIREIVDVPVVDNKASIQKTATSGEDLTILAYGLIPSAAARAKIDFDNIHTPADTDFVSAIDLQKMVREGEMSVTMTSGINVTIPSA